MPERIGDLYEVYFEAGRTGTNKLGSIFGSSGAENFPLSNWLFDSTQEFLVGNALPTLKAFNEGDYTAPVIPDASSGGGETLGELTVVLTPGDGQVTLAVQTGNLDYYYKTAASSGADKPSYDDIASEQNGWTYFTGSAVITATNGTLIWVQVVGAYAADNKIKAWGEASATPVAAGDTTAPTVTSATINGNTLTLVMSEDVFAVTEGASPSVAEDFYIQVNSGNRIYATGMVVSGNTVTLTFANPVLRSDTVTCGLVVDGGDPLVDAAGNDLEDFSAQTVTNNTPAPANITVGSQSGTATYGNDDASASFTVTAENFATVPESYGIMWFSDAAGTTETGTPGVSGIYSSGSYSFVANTADAGTYYFRLTHGTGATLMGRGQRSTASYRFCRCWRTSRLRCFRAQVR